MSEFLNPEDFEQLEPAREALFRSPIPTRVVSNGEFMPARQGWAQRRVEARIAELADQFGRKRGLNRRSFLASAAGMATAFLAMNEVYGPIFRVDRAEAADPDLAEERAGVLSSQFIFDIHTHYVRDDSTLRWLAEMRNDAGRKGYNHELAKRPQTLEDLHLGTYVKEIYLDSDTKIALLSGAPSDIPHDWFLTNDMMAQTRTKMNRFAGSTRLLSHFVFTPGQPKWLEAIDRGIEELRPDAWKGFTIGDNTHKDISRWPWRMDDEAVAYRGYEKFAKAGIRNVAIHKGLFTLSDQKRYPRLTGYARVDDVGKAAKDWPQLNFLIYHAAYRYIGEGEPALASEQFDRTGRMDWVSDLAEVREKYGVDNVYADLGASFAAVCVSQPRAAAAMIGILVKGLGADRVLWGTDSIWFGSPQWQIEAFRRLDIPQDMQRSHGFAPLGPADSPVKSAIFGRNSARLFNLDPEHRRAWRDDALSKYKLAYQQSGERRSNIAYGYVRKVKPEPV